MKNMGLCEGHTYTARYVHVIAQKVRIYSVHSNAVFFKKEYFEAFFNIVFSFLGILSSFREMRI